MEQLEYQLQRDNEMARQQIAKAIADRYGVAAAGAEVRPAAWNHDHRTAVVVSLIPSYPNPTPKHHIRTYPIPPRPAHSHHLLCLACIIDSPWGTSLFFLLAVFDLFLPS